MLRTPFFLKNALKLAEPILFKLDLSVQVVQILLELKDALVQRDLLVLEARYLSLELRLVCLLVVRNAFECLQLLVERVSLHLELCLRTLGIFELPSDMINMPL